MIYRIDVRSKPDAQLIDPQGRAIRQQIAEFGIDVGETTASRVFFIESTEPVTTIEKIGAQLLADPVVETSSITTSTPNDAGKSRIEVHLKPGVMDPVASSTEMAIRDMGFKVTMVRTGRAMVFGRTLTNAEKQTLATKVLANGVIESVHHNFHLPNDFSKGHQQPFALRHVQIRELNHEQLKKLSREGHLFLNLTEMLAVQKYYQDAKREPTDIELETIAQTWSEHCVHKTLKSAVEVVDPTGKVLRNYKNLIKETIFGSTQELIKRRNDGFCLSVFKDNAGVIYFDDKDAVCFKVETHNRPSAIEPYGGSATGIGGCIRDVLGTGLGAKPIANTDIFCVAHPDKKELPRGVIHPKRVLQQIVAGVRDYGNRMGIPTVNGAVYFDDNYIGNPLVFCGCVGLIPNQFINKKVNPGDAIVVMGGRTGRDGIHGATFSSAELTDKHSDEFSHAVQIGNAIEQKRMMDVLLQARDKGLYTALTDCGAGGLSSAIGEMGSEIGASVQLETVPLKYAGLRYDEIWISEAQERMVLSVPEKNIKALLDLSNSENVESTVIGTFGTDNAELVLSYNGTEVGRLAMELLHDGVPMPTRRAVVNSAAESTSSQIDAKAFSNHPHPAPQAGREGIKNALLARLSHPNIASKHWIIRQYDHEVQGGSVIKPLVGPLQVGPSDASVVRPKLNSNQGVVLSCGLAPHIPDPYTMSIAAIDEAIRNAVCVGATLDKLAILDNFCWPGTDNEEAMGKLVRACEACHDAALAFNVPFISGKDSLHNQFTDSETGKVTRIPCTLLISAIGVVEDVTKCITMDLKAAGNHVYWIKPKNGLAADLKQLNIAHRTISAAINAGLICSAHDVSDGGALTAAAEMSIASDLGLEIPILNPEHTNALFAEPLANYLLEVSPDKLDAFIEHFRNSVMIAEPLAKVIEKTTITLKHRDNTTTDLPINDLRTAWRGTLDW